TAGFWAGDGSVRCDTARNLAWLNKFDDFVERFERKIRGDLHQNRSRLRRDLLLLYCRQNLIERRFVLQLAQVWRVWRAYVHDKEIGELAQNSKRIRVVLGSS